ncbi:MAG: isoprenyl transferase [Phycisphaeraceae bacterium]|nr:isoprenyl transferase [Phycisphaeraceae bacterium]
MSQAPDNTTKPLPKHVAIIMDGNGRWAQARGKDRSYGHKAGAEVVRPIVTACSDLGLEALTLYAFSTENWTRSNEEVSTLMDLYVMYLESERQLFFDNNVRFNQIGSRDGLPPEVLDALDRMKEETKHHTGLTMTLALNYGSRHELTLAAKSIAKKVKLGDMKLTDITEQTITDHLYTAGLPDPDLLIRTAGEMRLSNYLLWQLSYAEFYVTDVCWPEFTVEELQKALAAFKGRTRRFGGVV